MLGKKYRRYTIFLDIKIIVFVEFTFYQAYSVKYNTFYLFSLDTYIYECILQILNNSCNNISI